MRSLCSNCGSVIKVPETYKGKSVKCPKCKQAFVAEEYINTTSATKTSDKPATKDPIVKNLPKDDTRPTVFGICLFKIAHLLGLTSGFGMICIGVWWFLWSLMSYLANATQIETAFQQIANEEVFSQCQRGAILAGIGVMILELRLIKAAILKYKNIPDSEKNPEVNN